MGSHRRLRPYKDLFALQDDISHAVAGALQAKLRPEAAHLFPYVVHRGIVTESKDRSKILGHTNCDAFQANEPDFSGMDTVLKAP